MSSSHPENPSSMGGANPDPPAQETTTSSSSLSPYPSSGEQMSESTNPPAHGGSHGNAGAAATPSSVNLSPYPDSTDEEADEEMGEADQDVAPEDKDEDQSDSHLSDDGELSGDEEEDDDENFTGIDDAPPASASYVDGLYDPLPGVPIEDYDFAFGNTGDTSEPGHQAPPSSGHRAPSPSWRPAPPPIVYAPLSNTGDPLTDTIADMTQDEAGLAACIARGGMRPNPESLLREHKKWRTNLETHKKQLEQAESEQITNLRGALDRSAQEADSLKAQLAANEKGWRAYVKGQNEKIKALKEENKSLKEENAFLKKHASTTMAPGQDDSENPAAPEPSTSILRPRRPAPAVPQRATTISSSPAPETSAQPADTSALASGPMTRRRKNQGGDAPATPKRTRGGASARGASAAKSTRTPRQKKQPATEDVEPEEGTGSVPKKRAARGEGGSATKKRKFTKEPSAPAEDHGELALLLFEDLVDKEVEVAAKMRKEKEEKEKEKE